MKDSMLKLLLIGAASLFVAACGTEISDDVGDFEPSAGDADFSVFLTVGDSLTAGYKDSALYREGQENSFGAILAQQFALVGGGAFTQPLMPVNATGSMTFMGGPIPGVNDRLLLVPTGNPERPAAPVAIMPPVPTEIFPPLVGAFNNLGVPAAKSFHLTLGSYGDPAGLVAMPPTANPFFVRFASAPGTTMITDAAAQAPSFFVLWIGNNDVLLYATAGGPGTAMPPYGTGTTDVTDPATFTAAFNGALGILNTLNNKGVLVNIPDVTTIPFFTTVPFNAIPMDQATADLSNLGFNAYNTLTQAQVTGTMGCPTLISQAEADRRQINFVAGQNPIVILDENLTDLTGCFGPTFVNMRQATASDYILLTASSKLGTDNGMGGIWGVSAPLLDTDVLIDTEVTAVETARVAYNATIKTAADMDNDLVLLDAAALLTKLNTTGISYGSGGISSTFAQGGAFSLDGVHPTARGYAVIANEIMKVINAGFGANLPPVDPNEYSTVFYQ